ncbi:MAG: hypothetical protein WCQ72_01575, partial [Eubacteriales bacterium]
MKSIRPQRKAQIRMTCQRRLPPIIAAFALTFVLAMLLAYPVLAYDRSAASYIPHEAARYLDEIADMDIEAGTPPGLGQLGEFLRTSVTAAFGGILSSFLKLMGTAAVLAVLHTVARDVGGMKQLAGYVGCAVCTLACADIALPAFARLTETVNELGVLVRSMTAAVGTLSAAGGAIASA